MARVGANVCGVITAQAKGRSQVYGEVPGSRSRRLACRKLGMSKMVRNQAFWVQ